MWRRPIPQTTATSWSRWLTYTVKRLMREKRKYVLKPENKAYPVLRPDTIEIAGVVVGSFRKYK